MGRVVGLVFEDRPIVLEKVKGEAKSLNEYTNPELKAMLDEKGIEYNDRTKKEDLIKLLEGAQ